MKERQSDRCGSRDDHHRSRWRNRRGLFVADRRSQPGAIVAGSLRATLEQNHLWAAHPGSGLGNPRAASANSYRDAGGLPDGSLWRDAFPPLHRPAQGTAHRSRARGACPSPPNGASGALSAAARAIGDTSAFRDWRHPLWLASLVVASVVFSLGLACAVPLAAFAAAAALSLSRRDALLLILLVWLTNQLVGFAWLDYPWTASTFAWGVTLGIVAVLATVAGQWVARRLAHASGSICVAATFLV